MYYLCKEQSKKHSVLEIVYPQLSIITQINKITNHGEREESNPVVSTGYVPQKMLRPFIDATGVCTLVLCLVQQTVNAP